MRLPRGDLQQDDGTRAGDGRSATGSAVAVGSTLTSPGSHDPGQSVIQSSVLIVEDSSTVRAMVSASLRAHARVIEAADALAGLDLLLTEEPDLIISDLHMPHMDGLEFARRIRAHTNARHRLVPIVLLTAEEGSIRGAAERAGVDEFLSKPVTPHLLRAMVERLLSPR